MATRTYHIKKDGVLIESIKLDTEEDEFIIGQDGTLMLYVGGALVSAYRQNKWDTLGSYTVEGFNASK